MAGSARLQTWLAAEDRRRFAAIAKHEGLSESALLRRLVELMLRAAQAGVAEASIDRQIDQAPPIRMTFRMRVDDHLLLKERAKARSMAAARYASIQLRSHLRNLAPLPKDEYLALKRSIAELARIGNTFNQIARAANRGEKVGSIRDDLKPFLKVCGGLRDHVRGLIADNVKSWRQGYGG